MYRLYDFHVGPKKQPQQQRSFHGGQMVLFVRAPGKHDDDNDEDDDDDEIPPLELLSDDGVPVKPASKKPPQNEDDDDHDGPVESNDDFLVVFVAGDKIVLDRATLNQPNNDGWTPLHACCHTVNAQEAGITILSELLKQNADLNQTTKRGPSSFSCGWTPLHIAVAYGLEALALKLIRAGANVNTTNSVKWTPLFEACHRNYATVARELLKAGAQHDVICPEFAMCPYPGQYALAEACRQGAMDTVKVLLEWGVDKNAVNKLGWTALHEAAYHNRIAIVKLLIVYGVDVMVKTAKGSVARDLTIWSDIRTILDDLMKDQAPAASSPKRIQPVRDDGDNGEESGASKSPKRSPATAAAPVVPLSRKEDYALLGDLPSLDARGSAPAIAIKDVDSGDSKARAEDDEDEEEEEGDRSPSKSKHKKGKRRHKTTTSTGDVPDAFKCAVTRKLLKHPLRSPYGQVFERKVMEAWFRDFGNRCPLTGQPLAMAQLTPDATLKAEIREWTQHGRAGGLPSKTASSATASSDTTRAAEPANHEAKELGVSVASASPEIDPYDF